jgi:hypothetical protein
MRRIRMGLLPGLLLALALTIGACSGGDKGSGVASLGGDKPTATTSAGSQDPRQKALAYARCMRQHGIDMPDPKFDAPGHMTQGLPAGVGPDDPKFKAADQACKQYSPNAGAPEKLDPQTQQQLLAFARCMRQHGIDIPDPKPGGGIDMRGSTASPDSPKFKAADQACQQYQPQVGDEQQQSSGGSR